MNRSWPFIRVMRGERMEVKDLRKGWRCVRRIWLIAVFAFIVQSLNYLTLSSTRLGFTRSWSRNIAYANIVFSFAAIIVGIILFLKSFGEDYGIIERILALLLIVTGAVFPALLLYVYILRLF